MKTLPRVCLFFASVAVLSGCKTQRLSTASEYSKFYNSINKEYDDAVAFTQSGISIEQREQEAKNRSKNKNNSKDSLYLYVTELSKDVKDLKAITEELRNADRGTSKSENNSAPANTNSNVAQPAAPTFSGPRPMKQVVSQPRPVKPVEAEPAPKSEPQPQSEVEDVDVVTPTFPVNQLNRNEKGGLSSDREDEARNIVRKMKFSLLDEKNRPLLKKYNVVIATLSREAGVQFVENAIRKSDPDEVVFSVKNAAGKYYVILGSYDTLPEALEKRKSVVKNYTHRFSKSALMKMYGIPFADTWIVYDEN